MPAHARTRTHAIPAGRTEECHMRHLVAPKRFHVSIRARMASPAHWQDDAAAAGCTLCSTPFSVVLRRVRASVALTLV